MKRLMIKGILALFAVILFSCSEIDETVTNCDGGPVRVDLAFSLSGSSAVKTRMADAVVQNGSAREIEILHVIPFISGNNKPYALELNNGGFWEKTNAQFFRANCDVEKDVDRFLVYAKAKIEAATVPDGVTSQAHNGSLTATFPEEITEATVLNSEIAFSPVPMVTSADAPDETAGKLAAYLTNIATATATINNTDYPWATSTNPILKKLYQNFTNKGEMIAGSATNVKVWGSQLKAALEAQTFADGSVEDVIRNKIMELSDETDDIDDITYPRSSDLPDGAIGMKWDDTKTKFVPQTVTTTTTNLNTITRFVYPPELYYFVNSTIKTSEEMVDYTTLYTSKDFWSGTGGVIDDDRFIKTVVEESTKSVALVDPVQYAVAQLKLTIRANAAELSDGKQPANNITVGAKYFPLTGVIVGGQRAVDYQFAQTSNGDADVKFVYDRQVKTNGNDYYYLAYSATEATDNTPGPNTLVLQSFSDENNVGEDVTIILEFENNSGALFYGVNQQIIYPDTRFYLVGTISHPTYDSTKGDYTRRVFTKDYITRVNVSVNSLAGAYNVLPNILSSNLEIGVETTPQWIAATPTTVIME